MIIYNKTFEFFLFLFAVIFLGGCGIDRKVTSNELDWRPSKLNTSECPNLSGDYIYTLIRNYSGGYESDLIRGYAGSVYELWRTASISPTTGKSQIPLDYSKNIPDFQSYYLEPFGKENKKLNSDSRSVIQEVLHLEQTAVTLLQGRSDQTRIVTKLGTEMAGCSGGALILRHLENIGGNDFIPRTVSYGEFEMRKNSDGSLKTTHRRRQRAVSFSSGMLGEQKEFLPLTRIYPPFKP